MSASTRTAGWTGLLAAAVAHDINNLVQTLANARALTAAPVAATADAPALFIEDSLQELRKLGLRLRTVAPAGEAGAAACVEDACADALAEVDPAGGRVLRGAAFAADARVRGTDAAVRTAIVSLLEHALAASPAAAPIQLTVRQTAGGPVIVEIAAPEVWGLGPIDEDRLDTLLATTLRDLRGDVSLALAGAIADAIGGTVHVASSTERGLVLALHLVAV